MLKQTISSMDGDVIEPDKNLGEIHQHCHKGKKASTLVESRYILSTQVIEMNQKFERHETQNHKSYIVQKDDETLIVS